MWVVKIFERIRHLKSGDFKIKNKYINLTKIHLLTFQNKHRFRLSLKNHTI